MTAATTTLLDAVNTCLATVGEAPVSSTTTTELLNVILAVQFINEVSRAVQSMTWDFNTDVDYTMGRDLNQKIACPSNILRIDTTRAFSAYDIVQRGAFLYDRARRLFTFDRDINVNVTWLFEFEELPEAARWYITVSAARKFQARLLGSEAREHFTAQDEARAWTTLKEAEGDTSDYNMLSGSHSVSNILDRSPDSAFPLVIG